MKKIVVLFVSMLVLATTASAGNDKPIQVSQLPQTAQQFIKKYFGDRKVAFAKEESDFRKSYEIAFKNGDKIEFRPQGRVDRHRLQVQRRSDRNHPCTDRQVRRRQLSRQQDRTDRKRYTQHRGKTRQQNGDQVRQTASRDRNGFLTSHRENAIS